MKKILAFLMAIFCFVIVKAEKKELDHKDLDLWQQVYNHFISPDGEWSVFSVNPQEGDGILTLFNTKTNKKIEIPRGYDPKVTADSKWIAVLIKPYFNESRKAKIDKIDKYDAPSDSLAIINLTSGEIQKIPEVVSFKIAKEGNDWIAYVSKDTLLVSKTKFNEKDAGKPLIIRNLKTGKNKVIKDVSDFNFSENGQKLGIRLSESKEDSLSFNAIGCVLLPDTSFLIIDRDKNFYGSPVLSREGKYLAYTASLDSAETGTKKCDLFLANLDYNLSEPRKIELKKEDVSKKHFAKPHSNDENTQNVLTQNWIEKNNADLQNLFINQFSKPEFSFNGRRLIIGVAPYVAPDDTTLVDFEKASLDIWRWDAPYTPPMEKVMIDDLKAHSYPVVIDIEGDRQTLLTNKPLAKVYSPDRWDGLWALIEDPTENIISIQWDYQFPVDLSVVNIESGEIKQIGKAKNELFEQSPEGNYVIWFSDRQYHCYNIKTGQIKDISLDIPYPLWEETQDLPLPEKEPYGIVGWMENDNRVLVYDRYDIWSLDPNGIQKAVCITSGEGRFKNLRFRVNTNRPDFRYFKDGEQLLLTIFDYETKKNGLATLKCSDKEEKPIIDILDGYTFYQIRIAKDKNVYSWVQGNFETSPNIFVSKDLNKKQWTQASYSNPQMKDYKWGRAELVKWYAYDGSPAEGILYLPEDFNENTSYPMIAYFYEKYTEDLYYHYDFEPSWSWINFPYYTSRGYVIFVPDIKYSIGLPGECAWNYVCSGVEEMCRKYPNIDINRVGIDGQSWGGYQTAYLITRTNMFACAGSGAPVSNMTSAFGGIRWSTGDSRQAQYEMGQSRLGRNLWESPQIYIANSPVFFADRIETPLLIMHNDADGAVPWYQGIEFFMALRRLGKPVWMLEYNDEMHNLKERRNRKDLTIRLQQFFDHYLKGSPMPEWMKKGIPAIRKGQEFGY